MSVSPKDYDKMTQNASPPSKSLRNAVCAFLIGGLICTLGQGIMQGWLALGLEQEAAASCTSVSLVFLSILLTGLQVYDNIAQVAGAGTLVPITGFANAMSSPAIEFKTEGMVLGVGAKMFIIAGPVIVYGISASVVYGLVVYLFGLA